MPKLHLPKLTCDKTKRAMEHGLAIFDHTENEKGKVMSPWDLLWIAVLGLALQPALARRWAAAQRQSAIARIEQARQSRLILLVHREERIQFLGIPVMRYIDLGDAEAIARAVEIIEPTTPIDVVLHTPGGLMLASVQIARALKRHKGKVTVFVPHYAMSGGTLIALAADEIVLSTHAVLGAVDPQVEGLPAASLLRVIAEKPIAEIDDETLILADMGTKALDEIESEVACLLTRSLSPDKAKEIAVLLTQGRWTHEHGLSASEVQQFGLKISEVMPPEIMRLMDHYQQPMRPMPSVAFSPFKRSPTETPAPRPRRR